MKKLQIDVRISVNNKEMTWGDFCRQYYKQAEEILDQMQIIMEGNASIVFDIEEEQPEQKQFHRRYGGRQSLQETILSVINEHQGITADEIMKTLKIKNKKSVWQTVHSLRKRGYKIVIDENKGYRLVM